MGDNFDLAIANLTDLNYVSEVTDAAFDLDFVVKEFLERGDVENLIRGGLGGVDDELRAFCQRTRR